MKWQALVFASVGLALGAPAPGEDKPKAAAKAIQGTWVVTAMMYGGETQAVDGKSRVVITDDRFSFEQEGRDTVSGTFTIDPAKKPATIDVSILEGPDEARGKKGRGIYLLDGDSMKWAFGELGEGDRPPGFADNPPPFALLSFRRNNP